MAGARTSEVAPGVHMVAVGRGIAASNVYFLRSETSWALVDTGWRRGAPVITAAAAALFGAGSKPSGIFVTHLHPDHSGSAGELARRWGVPVLVHPDELPLAAGGYVPRYASPLDRWIVRPVMRAMPRRRRERILAEGSLVDVARAFDPGAGLPGLPGWEAIATPGHTPGHVAFFRRSDGVLISGDAVLTIDLNSLRGLACGRQKASGPPRISTWRWPTEVASIADLAALEPRILAPGHGRPIVAGAAAALRALADAVA